MSDFGHEAELEHRLTETEERSKSNTKRIDELTKQTDVLQKLATNMAVMTQKQETMETDVAEIKASVKTMEEKPAKRWDGLIEKIVAAIVGGLIGFLLVKMGVG